MTKKKKTDRPWWLPPYHVSPSENIGDVNYYNFGEFPVMKCSRCNKAWEYGMVGRNRTPVYYDEFPSYKLKNKTCPNCKDNKKKDNK